VIDPAYPDYDRIRAIVDEALDPVPAADDDAANGTPTPTPTPAPTPTPTPAPGPPTVAPGEPGAATDVTDACAYDPARAAEARAAGEPPNKAG
jgi:hypothetical protein